MRSRTPDWPKKNMYILSVHSSSPSLSVAVSISGQILSEEILPAGKRHLEQITPLISRVAEASGVSINALGGFAVALGPGTFSGIRVGIATVKGLAMALQRPVAGLSSLELIAWQALGEDEWGISIIDAKRNEVYAALYRRTNGLIELMRGPLLLRSDAVASELAPPDGSLIFCGDSIVDKLAEQAGPSVQARVIVPSAAACAIPSYRYLSQDVPDAIHTLAPIYIRRSDAEEKRLK